MRNLVILSERRRSTEFGNHSVSDNLMSSQATICDLCCFRGENGAEPETVVLTKEGVIVRVTQEGEPCWVCYLNDVCPGGEWFDLTYVDSVDALVCLSNGGGIVAVSPGSGQAELVGEFDNGLEAGAWSPDGEVLFLVTFSENDDDSDEKNSVLLTMNGQWEVLSEVVVETHVPSSHEAAEDTVVSVCWRPDGTACAISAVDAHDQRRRIRTYDRETLSLKSVGRSEDGSGKLVPGLLGDAGLGWASGGCSNLLAAVQRKSKRILQVAFFEPNGLRHREFALRPERCEDETSPPNQPQPLGLSWNVESDLLSIVLRESGHYKVQLWHRSNYHWYLKQELRFPNGYRVSRAMFHDELPYLLYVVLHNEDVISDSVPKLQKVEWREFEFCWDPSTVAVSAPQPNSCQAVSVDGCLLNVTPLEKRLVPPPMYAQTLDFDLPIRGVTFAPICQKPLSMVLQLSDGNLMLLGNSNVEEDSAAASPSLLAKVSWTLTDTFDSTSIRNFLVMGGEGTNNSGQVFRLVAIRCPPVNGASEELIEIEVMLEGDGAGKARVTNTISFEGRVLRMIPWANSAEGALLELEDGTILEFEPSHPDGGRVIPSDVDSLLEPCPWLAAMKNVPDADHRAACRLVVGLSSRSRLYCHDRLLADAASSFVLSPTHEFLCYATAGSHCQLRFLPLTELLGFDPLMGSDENHLLGGYEPRNVERGTRLVAVLPKHPSTILQLPRGNMECVYPRALVLPFVMSKIDVGEYGPAFEMMRRQRVDLNLIVDMDPRHFLTEGVESFVSQVRDVDYLNLFIATLQDMDVTEWKYRVPRWFRRRNAGAGEDSERFDHSTKVNQVCRLLRKVMISRQQDCEAVSGNYFLLPILSTFAKEKPLKLEEALMLIKDNAINAHPSSSRKPPLFSETAQSSIQYLAFLADYELLFDTALGMYDYDLARAVARNSQMDPKVYLPLLKRLKLLDTFFGRFEVDVRLKRYEKALSNLFQSGVNRESLEDVTPSSGGIGGNDFEHCMSFIEEHKLHGLGLKLYSDHDARRRQIMISLGERLMRGKQSESALAVHLAAEPPDHAGATHAARACGNWELFFSLWDKEATNGDESVELRRKAVASEIAEEIAAGKGGKNSRQAALLQAGRILLDYGKDVVGAIDKFIAAEKWSEARRIASLHSRQDLSKKCVDAAVSYARNLFGEFEDRATAFEKANERYEEVLKIRIQAVRSGEVPGGETGAGDVNDGGSLFSMASNASNMSMRSTMSSSSVGSVSSVSSVISVGAVSSFSITSERDVNKHKSKFNKTGREKKKAKKKKKTGKKKMKPGSEEELNSLISTLKVNRVDKEYCDVVAETTLFLIHVGNLSLAREVYDSYLAMTAAMASSQERRISETRRQREDAEREARKEGQHSEPITLPVEKEVDSLHCEELPEMLNKLFSYL